jgi:hypothetical protein
MSTPRIDYKTADKLVRALIDASYKKHGSYSHAAGMLSSILCSTLAGRTVKDVKQTILDIQNLTDELERKDG